MGGIRGVTVGPIESSQQPGRGYGSAASAVLVHELRRLGVTWISLTPFGRIWDLQSTRIDMDFEAPFAENRQALARMIAQAHEAGLRVIVMPMLWVDRSAAKGDAEGSWRGEIDPRSDEGWKAYQHSYREFILAWAKTAAEADADGFALGVECMSWSSRFPDVWFSLIDRVRSIFPGLLTYAANWWAEAEQVVFWDRLDLIGIQAFYELAKQPDAPYASYLEGAARAKKQVEALAQTLDKPVLFTEVGYTTRRNAGSDPWRWPDGMKDVAIDEWEQARALAAIFQTFLGEEWFAGFFVWRYFAHLDDISQEPIWGFSPHAKQAEALLRDVYATRFASDPEPWPWSSHALQTEQWWRHSALQKALGGGPR